MTKIARNSGGRVLSKETKLKISLAHKGVKKIFSETHRINLGKSQLGNTKGKKMVYVGSIDL